MLRAVVLSSLLVATTLEGASPEPELLRYAITQGGLLAVVFVLLFFYRRDFMRSQATDREEALISRDQMEMFRTLVGESTAAITRGAESSERVARALENLQRGNHR